MTYADIYTRAGKPVKVDISEEATLPFGFRFQDRVSTPRGIAYVVGAANGTVYFRVEGEEGATFWSSCKTKQAFIEREFQIAPARTDGIYGHKLKHVSIANKLVNIVLQNVNGPCPILAIANALVLLGKIHIGDSHSEAVNADELCRQLAAYAERQRAVNVSLVPNRFCAPSKLRDTLTIKGFLTQNRNVTKSFTPERLHKLYSGVDVSPIFSAVDAFAGDQDSCVFASHGLRLFHVWYIAEGAPLAKYREYSYDQLGEVAIEDPLANAFVTGQQLTVEGLAMLQAELLEGEVGVLFRSNHFSVVTKRQGQVLVLQTDEGFADKPPVVFEQLTAHGDGALLNGDAMPIDPIVLQVINGFGATYSEADILHCWSALRSETNPNPTADDVVAFMRDQRSGGAAGGSGGGGGSQTPRKSAAGGDSGSSSTISSRSQQPKVAEGKVVSKVGGRAGGAAETAAAPAATAAPPSGSGGAAPSAAASSEVENMRSQLLGMGFNPYKIEEVLRTHHPRDIDTAVTLLV